LTGAAYLLAHPMRDLFARSIADRTQRAHPRNAHSGGAAMTKAAGTW
jgi:hypothetical protein